MLIKKLLLLSLLANKQTVPQSTQLLFLNHAVSPSHAHSNTLSVKCLFEEDQQLCQHVICVISRWIQYPN